jgi:hypothetical protein
MLQNIVVFGCDIISYPQKKGDIVSRVSIFFEKGVSSRWDQKANTQKKKLNEAPFSPNFIVRKKF